MNPFDPAGSLAALLAELAAAEAIRTKLAELDQSMRLADPPYFFSCPSCSRSIRVLPSQPGLRIGHELPPCKAWSRIGLTSS